VNSVGFLDLFAGCGGLSLGLEKAGLNLVAAVEKSDMAGKTHFKNFEMRGQEGDVFDDRWEDLLQSSRDGDYAHQVEAGLVIGDVWKLLDDPPSMRALKEKGPRVIVGGPPCQGFSMAGRRNPEDKRNQLPDAFLDFVKALRPEAVVIENVAGINMAYMARGGTETPFSQLRLALEGINDGYVVQSVQLNARHFGIPQNRPRMMLIALRKDVANSIGISNTEVQGLWRSSDAMLALANGDDDPSLCRVLVPRVGSRITGDPVRPPREGQDFWHSAQDGLRDLDEVGYLPKVDYREKEFRYAREMRFDPQNQTTKAMDHRQRRTKEAMNHKQRNHTLEVRQRFDLYRFFSEERIPNSVLALPSLMGKREDDNPDPLGEAEVRRQISVALDGKEASPTRDFYTKEDECLVDVIMRLATRKHSQRVVNGEIPAPTVVTLPDDYIHPTESRIMTVRELARFQSFPDWFEFCSKETTGSHRRRIEVPQYSQVGNAVPPLMAKAIGELLVELLPDT